MGELSPEITGSWPQHAPLPRGDYDQFMAGGQVVVQAIIHDQELLQSHFIAAAAEQHLQLAA